MSFPTEVLRGYRYNVLSLTDEQAKLLVFVGKAGLHGLARDLASRCPAAIFAITRTHYAIEHFAFRGEITKCRLFPATAVLDVRAPGLDLRNALGALPVAVGRYVSSETGSVWCGVAAGLGALVMVTHLAPAFARSSARREWGS